MMETKEVVKMLQKISVSVSDAYQRLQRDIELSEPIYSRSQVLREEWEPTYDKSNEHNGYIIYSNNSIGDFIAPIIYSHFKDCLINLRREGCSFSPTRELAEEIVQIRKGEWVPTVGDFTWDLYKKGLIPIIATDGVGIKRLPFDKESFIFFPSAKQRGAFIEKNKPETTIERHFFYGKEIIIDGNGFLKIKA